MKFCCVESCHVQETSNPSNHKAWESNFDFGKKPFRRFIDSDQFARMTMPFIYSDQFARMTMPDVGFSWRRL
jgi:hypothetical protein